MSKLQDSPAAYADVRTVFDLAVERGELIYELPTIGKAVNFKQRANRFRNIERERLEEQGLNIPGFRAETAYDQFELVFGPPYENDRKQSSRVWFRRRSVGKFIDPETGEEINV